MHTTRKVHNRPNIRIFKCYITTPRLIAPAMGPAFLNPWSKEVKLYESITKAAPEEIGSRSESLNNNKN